MRVIFIASLSHSGSTLLDLMLNAHPQMVSVGELKQLGRLRVSRRPVGIVAAPVAPGPCMNANFGLGSLR